jgi:LysR family transcriptional regulator, hydrogen peroxide-inducible genes activator
LFISGITMTVSELRYLVAVADLRHFGRAAERCEVSQPSLSGQLLRLEDTLGVSLVERTTRFVALTPIGERIVAHARRIIEQADLIAHLARHGQGTLAGDLRVGIIPTLAPYILPQFLGALQKKFPALHLALQEDLTDNLLTSLAAHTLDVVLIALPEHADAMPVMPLFVEPLRLVCPPAHRFSRQSVVTARDLVQERLLLLEEGHCLRDQALALCGTQLHDQTRPRETFRAASLDTICEMVAAGFGCTLLPAMAVRPLTARHARLAVRPLQSPQAHRRIGMVWRASFPRAQDLEVLGRFIQDQLPDSVTPIRPKAAPAGRRRAAPHTYDPAPAPRRSARRA